MFSAIGYFIPAFGDGQNIASIIGASVILWCVHFLILRGVQSAAMINLITTISKLVPIFAFIIAIIFLIGWIITGVGMIALAFSFQNLTTKRPDLDGGIFTYAREGFGHFMGFNSGWGYWFAALLGNVAYGTLDARRS
ncbi:amino acid permease [Bacillus licheniformis]|nr:amino acid permease [Bacillus licheniformis]